MLVDVDDTIVEVHGYAKQGAGFGYTKVRALNALLATVSTSAAAPVTNARKWEPKRLRLRLYAIPATLARTGRRILLHVKATAPWAALVTAGWTRLDQLAAPT